MTTETKLLLIKTAEIIEIKQPPKTEPEETKEYKEAMLEKQRVDKFGQRVIYDLQTCDNEIAETKREIETLLKSKNNYQKNRFKRCDVDFQDLFAEELSNR